MTNRPLILAAAISLALLAQGASAAAPSERKGTKTYRWVDNNGVVHLGDTIPPEFSTQGRAELNSHGVPVREFPRQLSPAEAIVAQKSAADEARRRQHDSFLLTTYTKVADIEQLRDERLALIEGQMEIARGSITGADQRLGSLRERLKSFRPYSASPAARRVPDQLAEEVVRTLKERRSLQTALESREKEKQELRSQFDTDISRYRELTTRPAGR
jgi:hypothetical protein